jgi:hypothetical protein
MSNGIPGLSGGQSALTISVFDADLHSVNAGSQAVLTWQVSSDATDISIDNGVGDVFAISSCGVGSTSVTVNASGTYTLTLKRGTNTVTSSINISAITGTAPGWNYVGGFNEQPIGPLLNQGNWQTVLSSPETFNYQAAQVEGTITGNHVLGIIGAPDFSAGFFGSHSTTNGGSNTLFFRFFLDPSINVPVDDFGDVEDLDLSIGVSDAILFDVVSFTGTDKGPSIRLTRNAGGAGGPIDLTADWGAGNTNGFDYTNSVDPTGLAVGTVYNVWIDFSKITNTPSPAESSFYSVTVQKGGDSGTIQNLFTNQISDRTNDAGATINEVFIAGNKALTTQGTNNVLLDDFYLSNPGGYNHTIPVPQGSFIRGSAITLTSVSKVGTSVFLTWSQPGGTNTFTVQSRPSVSSGSWSTVQTGISSTNLTVPNQTGTTEFYRVTSP